MLRFLEDKNLK